MLLRGLMWAFLATRPSHKKIRTRRPQENSKPWPRRGRRLREGTTAERLDYDDHAIQWALAKQASWIKPPAEGASMARKKGWAWRLDEGCADREQSATAGKRNIGRRKNK